MLVPVAVTLGLAGPGSGWDKAGKSHLIHMKLSITSRKKGTRLGKSNWQWSTTLTVKIKGGKCFYGTSWEIIFLFSSRSLFNHLISPWFSQHCCLQPPFLSIPLPWYGLSPSLSWTMLELHLTDPILTLSEHLLNLNLALEDPSPPHASQCPLATKVQVEGLWQRN